MKIVVSVVVPLLILRHSLIYTLCRGHVMRSGWKMYWFTLSAGVYLGVCACFY
jgi:hypothetical protein